MNATVTEADCKGAGGGRIFDGKRPRDRPVTFIDVSMFGFDLDIFEVKLHELNEVVDLFCVVEMGITHRG